MSSARNVTGKVVAVIGGANGIGLATVKLLAESGAKVAIGDYAGDAARQAAAEIGGEARGYDLDVANIDSLAAFVESVRSELGEIDVLINSAGVLWVGPFADEPQVAAERHLAVNLLGVINAVKVVVPTMRARGHGQIITIASAASLLPTPGEATYAASKHGVLGYLKAVRAELHKSGVQITAILPAVVETELAVGTSTGAATILQPVDVAKAIVKSIGQKRFAITVPKFVGITYRFVSLLPQVGQDLIMRALVPNQVEEVDREARANYESQFKTD